MKITIDSDSVNPLEFAGETKCFEPILVCDKLLHIAMYCGVRHIHVYFTCLIAGEFWIGISDIIEEDRWIYSSDLQVTRVKDFHPGEPNQHTSANCVALWKRFRGYWADEPCETHYNFICEQSQE